VKSSQASRIDHHESNFSGSPVSPPDFMTAATLFPSVLGSQFVALDPCLKWVHSGESRILRGSVTVERGGGVVARMSGVLAGDFLFNGGEALTVAQSKAGGP
jgi:hypothetical protein